ncbi:MAG: amidohydrolase [Bacteroidetes bacterium]|nr:amidohydrolase [Bacteroidota bacterium]
MFIRLLIFSCTLWLISCNNKQTADLVIHHAVIYTVDSTFSQAEAMAVKDGKILAIGTNNAILQSYQSDSMIDAKGKAIFPGFIDAHAHFVGYAGSLFQVNLFDSKSIDEIIQRLEAFTKEHPGKPYVIGSGWDQNKFPGKKFPDNKLLNQLYPNIPVILERVDGHACLANQKALDMARVVPGQKINGGEIITENGQLTGILVDNATGLLSNIIPPPSNTEFETMLLAAQKNCFEQGLTTITDCGLNYPIVDKIDSLQKAGKILMRLSILLSDNKENYDRYLPKGPYKSDLMSITGFKLFADGALGSRGACLLQPYADQPGWSGFLLSPISHFDSIASILSKTKFQMCTHAIGDSANRVMLTIYNKYLQGKNDRRWRIEHAQVINPADFALFGKASIIPSVQPTHATSDMYWAEERLGPEWLKTAYANKQLLQQNGWIALGTDFPVEDISPFKTFLAAVFRQDAKGFPAGGFQPDNALTREEAIRGMTIWAAKADFLENETGSLEKGKSADFILLTNDLMKVDAKNVLTTKVIATYSRGKKVWGE